MSDPLDNRIRALVVHVAEASPTAPSFSEILEREQLPSPSPSRLRRDRGRGRWPRIAIAVVLLVALAGGAAFAWTELRSDDRESSVVTRPQPRRPGWRGLPAGPLEARSGEVAVWTGREFIVWGGATFGAPASGFADGARYDTKTGRWHRIAASPLRGRFYASAVWTGREMIVWGGGNPVGGALFGDGAAYNPKTNRWRVLPAAPLDPRVRAVAVWSGKEVLIWGGSTGSGPPQSGSLFSGAAYNPKTRSWRQIAAAPFDRTDQPTHGVWSGSEMIIWGIGSPTRTRGAAAYKPSTETWRLLPPSPVTQLGGAEPTVWTGTQLIVPGAQVKTTGPGATYGAAYNQPQDTWRPIAPAPPGLFCGEPISVWTGRTVLSFCGALVGRSAVPVPATLASYDPSSDHWQTLDVPPAPIETAAGLWTGRELIVWGVTHDANGNAHAAGAAYVPQRTSEQAPKLSCDVTTVPAQSASVATTCSAESFPTATSVTFSFGGSRVGQAKTDATGRARLTFRIPTGLPPGEATISASGGGLEVSTTAVVTAAPAAS